MKQLIISGGIYKNHKIACPPGEIRPPMNIMREAIFQILDNRFHFMQASDNIACNNTPRENGLSFLDLFSGSGLMAIEAISRGFSYATSVEMDKQKWKVIYNNISVGDKKIYLAKESAEKFLLRNNKVFDIIFVDPPFRYKYKNDVIKKVIRSRACAQTTVMIIHMPKKESVIDLYDSFVKVSSRNYGGSGIHIFTHAQVANTDRKTSFDVILPR